MLNYFHSIRLFQNLPKWMIPKSGFVHPLYEQIWQYVKSDKRDRTCDTNLVSQLLMTSGLPIDVLGGLWSMANVGVEGSLSQQELYIILALITLVQVNEYMYLLLFKVVF